MYQPSIETKNVVQEKNDLKKKMIYQYKSLKCFVGVLIISSSNT